MGEFRWSQLASSGDGLFEPARRAVGRGEYRGLTFHEVEARSIISKAPPGTPWFGYSINAYRGCSNACVYCFARPTHDYLGFNMGSDFETQIVVKVNAIDLLRAELSPARWGGDHIAMGTNTDPYQAAEGKYRLTRGMIEILLAHQNSFSILTKSPLVLRDLDLITAASKTTDVRVDLSIATMDEDVWRRTEPGVPHPRRRMEAVAKLRAAGIPSSVMMAPIIPGISDHPNQIADVKRAASEAGAESVHEVRLHLRGVRSHFLEWLENDSPELVPMYLELYPERRKAKSQEPAPRSTDGQLSLGL